MSVILFIIFNALIIFLFLDKHYLVKEYEAKTKTLEQKSNENSKNEVFIQNNYYYGVSEVDNE